MEEGQRLFGKQKRQESAKALTEARAQRSAKEQIAILDKRFGVGIGAVKERARLQTKMSQVKEKNEKKKTEK